MIDKIVLFLFVILMISGCNSTYASTNSNSPTPFIEPTVKPDNSDTLFFDDFSDEKSGWIVEDNSDGLLSYTSGEYYIYGYKSDLMPWSIHLGREFADAVLNVEYRFISGDPEKTGSAIFWRLVDSDNFYFLQIFGDGYYAVSKYLDGNLIPITESAENHFLNTDKSSNKIKIAFKGNTADFYFNSKYVTSITDTSFSSGYIGLGVFPDFSSDVQIAFDDLYVYKYDLSNSHTPQKPIATSSPTYRSITWMELVDFIARDHTNWNQYDINNYVCLDFAIDLVENARKENINAWIVGVDFSSGESGHAFVAFKTSDKGTIYVEPQADSTYSNMTVGNYLCDDWGKAECMGKITSITHFSDCDNDHYCTEMTP